ncbi:hypothetical protein UY3_13058 [Chelonia mydas]|uniref:Uncharacterized protein n=1 Tax=Chelonia mydas TaxID=8469 RepID=M7AYM9_CHEMY|nr:hypothetical protein UY3_13058 [Chelonia mydas]
MSFSRSGSLAALNADEGSERVKGPPPKCCRRLAVLLSSRAGMERSLQENKRGEEKSRKQLCQVKVRTLLFLLTRRCYIFMLSRITIKAKRKGVLVAP